MTGAAVPERTRVRTDILSPSPAQAMQALLDRDPGSIREGDPLPLGWHWLYFNKPVRASGLGPDGHERRGAFMPEVDLPRRMWAGGKLRLLSPVRIGEPAELRSGIRGLRETRGKSGRLVFVTVGHALLQSGRPCVEEEQVIVYGEAQRPRDVRGHAQSNPTPGQQPAAGTAHAAASWTRTFTPTTVTLFQFSALTYNGHRIHYDHPYVTEREGYPGVLVHGPLTALLLLDAARRHAAAPPSAFRYRALAPLFVDEPITLAGRTDASRDAGDGEDSAPAGQVVEALGPTGAVAMRGRIG